MTTPNPALATSHDGIIAPPIFSGSSPDDIAFVAGAR
jgi:hypothetical protein